MVTETPSDIAGLKKLREPFPPDWISKLPKPTKRENTKGKCGVCNGYHGLPAVHIDYVGHADLTARLLDVDPLWNWEPMALTPEGTPHISVVNGVAAMWIQLTVCGMTRLGVGTAPANKEDVLKELVGDALRNAAMRFGAALDLWSKTERGSAATPPDPAAAAKTTRKTPPVKPDDAGGLTYYPPVDGTEPPAQEPPPIDVTGQPEAITKPQLTKMHILFKERNIHDRTDGLNFLASLGYVGVESTKELSKEAASVIIDKLDRMDPL